MPEMGSNEVADLKDLLESTNQKLEDQVLENEELKTEIAMKDTEIAELKVIVANPAATQELKKTYVENENLVNQIKALTKELTETCQKMEELEALRAYEKKDLEKRLKQIKKEKRDLDPNAPFSKLRVDKQREKIAKERGDEFPDHPDTVPVKD